MLLRLPRRQWRRRDETEADDVTPWLDLVHKLFPDQADHIVAWLAQRVQRPHEKINHALVLAANPVSASTILEPVKAAIGPWNFAYISPKQALGRFNGFFKSVILRVNAARTIYGRADLTERNRVAAAIRLAVAR
ncbi:MAG: hypothetical protein ACXWCY_33540 [Burkholderiales bacterium]